MINTTIIISISATRDRDGDEVVFGLGSDGLVYLWNVINGVWDHYGNRAASEDSA